MVCSMDGGEDEEQWHNFDPRALMYAMAPVDHVMAPFLLTERTTSRLSSSSSAVSLQEDDEHESTWEDDAVERQDSFALLVSGAWKDEYNPSRAYLCHLVKSYCQRIGDDQIQSEALMELMLEVLSSSSQTDIPSEREACYQSFWIPPLTQISEASSLSQKQPMRLRVYPKHNDVALRLWEGGAALAEFWLAETTTTRQGQDQHSGAFSSWLPSNPLTIVELGAGIGATALALLSADKSSSCCSIRHIYATDYKRACMENLYHNLAINHARIRQQQEQHTPSSSSAKDNDATVSIISAIELDWTWFDQSTTDDCDQVQDEQQSTNSGTIKQAQTMLAESNVLLAADVAYDPSVLPSLAKTIHYFLSTPSTTSTSTATMSSSKQKMALLATTRRNLNTFQKLHSELEECGVQIHSLGRRHTKDPPLILFPAKFHQPRSDVWYTVLTLPLSESTEP